jgi:hypothetical protein
MAEKKRSKRLPKLTDAQRHERFVQMAREVQASDDPAEFDKAFKTVMSSLPRPRRRATLKTD